MCFTKYYRNFILCGEADHHCLLCDETFHKFDDIEKHIRWEKHRKVIKTQSCLPKFKNDGIFKIENYYYCQFCNRVAHNMASIKEHIATETHTSYKTTPEAMPKRIKASCDSGNVTINKIKIDTYQWHGIQNKQCLLCNAAVTNILKHIETQDHVIRLIQTETINEGEDKPYRKVNQNTFQCFKCMKTFPSQEFDIHWKQHNMNPVETQEINGVSGNPIRIYDRDQYNKLGDREYDIAKFANINDDFYNIDMKNKEITCKKCKSAVRCTQNDLRNHMFKKHKDYSSKSNIIGQIKEDTNKEYIFIYEIDAGKARHELANYGKDNHIKMNAGGSKGYCMLCDRFLSAHINIFKQHVGGAVHSGHLEMQGQIKPKKHIKGPTRTEIFSRHIFKLDYITDFDAVAVNMVLCIDIDSFLLIKRIKHGKHLRSTKCFVCDETFKWWKEKEHCESNVHKTHVMAAKVVTEKLNINFTREIKPKLYHCGLCNITLPFWETLEKHIDDMSHKTKFMEKHYATSMKHFQEQHGSMPEVKEIKLSMNSDVFYSNILKVLFESRLGDLRIFTINLEKLKESGKSGIVLLA